MTMTAWLSLTPVPTSLLSASSHVVLECLRVQSVACWKSDNLGVGVEEAVKTNCPRKAKEPSSTFFSMLGGNVFSQLKCSTELQQPTAWGKIY